MQFNRSKFNHGLFNRTDTGEVALYGGITWLVGANAASGLETVAPVSGSASITYGVGATTEGYVMSIPLTGNTGISFTGTNGNMELWTIYYNAPTGITFAVSGSLRNNDATSFTLEGLNLATGESVTIDTDTLEIFVRGQQDLTAWVTGGDWFKLSAGNNDIEVYTDTEETDLDITVQWQDRWY